MANGGGSMNDTKSGFLKRLFGGGKAVPAPLPLPAPEVPVVKLWELTAQEEHFLAGSKKSFRTRAFKNLSLPDQPDEYLQADFALTSNNSDEWTVRKISAADGRALPVLSENADAQGRVPVQSSMTLEEHVCVMRALHKMALFEFGTNAQSAHSLREEVVEDLTGSHFIDFAHNEGIVFDVNGHPSFTHNGQPVRDGKYPASELKFAAAVYEAEMAKKAPVLNLISFPALDVESDRRSGDRMKDFEYFSSVYATAQGLSASIMNCEKHIYGQIFNQGGRMVPSYTQTSKTPLPWDKRHRFTVDGMRESVKETLPLVQKMLDLADCRPELVDENECLRNMAVGFLSYHAAFLYSGYQARVADFLSADSILFAHSLVRDIDKMMERIGFEEGQKNSMHKFILSPHKAEFLAQGFIHLETVLRDLKNAFHMHSCAAVAEESPKVELPDYRDLTLRFNAIALGEIEQESVPSKAEKIQKSSLYTDEEIDRDVKAFHKRLRSGHAL
ncbi:hypothetical protein [Micavibrio aeruginosavorus]|uniref:hypothetical protein n=1 Tax=Micavibrio aeruginosavorus TaxID=349221 RepID=UPI003F4AC14D